MMAGEKTVVNYTAEQTAEMVEMYTAGEAIENIATKVGKSVRSVIAKLSREGVYKAKSKAKGEGRVTKAELVQRLETALGADSGSLATLEKASHEALEFLAKQLA
jgi:hypothetical protein